MTNDWIRCADGLPPEGEWVETMVQRANGCVAKTRTLRCCEGEWFSPGEAKAVERYSCAYPTHWRRLKE